MNAAKMTNDELVEALDTIYSELAELEEVDTLAASVRMDKLEARADNYEDELKTRGLHYDEQTRSAKKN